MSAHATVTRLLVELRHVGVQSIPADAAPRGPVCCVSFELFSWNVTFLQCDFYVTRETFL